MSIEVFLVNSFTSGKEGGNPAGVVLNADNLTNEQKLKIAQIVGYSETAFVSSDEEVDFNVSFFTTTNEVDFCGHATLAAFFILHKKGIISSGKYVQKTKAGLLPVFVETNGHIVMDQQLPKYLGTFNYDEISTLIGLDKSVLEKTKLPIETISTGLSDIIVPVPLGYLDRLQPNDHLISEFCQNHKVVGIHAFELCSCESEFTASCRNFAPLVGIPEESATGSSSGALACYLSKYLADNNTSQYLFEQGRAMNVPSVLSASVEYQDSTIYRVKVGGFANEISTLYIDIGV